MGLVFGVTTYAASTVWASFMAGLAIGSLGAGRVADRVRRPLVWFGVCELLIAITALLTPAVLSLLQDLYVRVYPSLPTSLWVVTSVRFLIAFSVLIVPTALMGATLPLVIKSSAFRATNLGERMALLYAMNTAGAILGALAAGIYLVPALGIQGTFLVAAAINGAVSVAGLAAGLAMPVASRPIDSLVPGVSSGPATPVDRRGLRVVLWVFAVSGFTALALEVVWARVLTLFLRPTVYGYSLMLAAVLAGIAVGSYIVTPLLNRRRPWLTVLAMLEVAIAVAAVLSFSPLAHMGGVADSVAPLLSRVMAEWLIYPTVGSFLTIFPTALLMGMAFPIGLRLWSMEGDQGSDALARRIGTFYSLNVTGAILGSIAAGFVMLPLLGSRASVIVLGAVSLACGLALLVIAETRGRTRAALALASVVVFAASVWTFTDPLEQFVEQRYRGQQVLWHEEGVEATTALLRHGTELSLTVNGNHQASTGESMVHAHRRIGHLPMVLHPNPREALVIGLGGGATAGAVSIHDGVEVDVVELAGSVVRGAGFLEAINYAVLTRPNVRLHVDDGRNFMMLSRRQYDVITADVILPIYAGSGNLYSAEYFRLARSVLKPGGMVLQWVAGTDAEYKSIARTFLSVFPNATAWGHGDLLIGTVEPFRLHRRDFERKRQLAGSMQGIRDLGITTFEELLKFYRAGPDELRAFVGEGPILTDDLPLVEYFLSLPRDRDTDFAQLAQGDVTRLLTGE